LTNDRPLIRIRLGGRTGGGAAVTPFGRDVLRRYLRVQAKATRSIERDLGTFRTLLKSRSRL
jgi:molybdate transport system regulatory protein